MIEALRLTKRYGSFTALREVSFTVQPGRILGLLGPNGAGKTTLLRILCGYHYPSSGAAIVAGHDIVEDSRAARAVVGYVPETVPLYGEFSVLEYLRFCAAARGLRASSGRRAVERAIEACGLGNFSRRLIGRLSRGYRQRTGLAQALLHDPPVLILDEPTSGLDPNQIVEIRALIRRLGHSRTVILSTHILSEARSMCERVLILNQGRVAAEGSSEDIGRRIRGADRFMVVFGAAAGLRREDLEGIPGLVSVAEFSPERDTVSAVLLMTAQPGAAELIFDWSVARGLKLVRLEKERFDLEDIFSRVTAAGGENA